MDEALKLWLEVIKNDPYFAGEMGGDLYCFFCGEWQVKYDANVHSVDCVYIRAKQLCSKLSTATIER